MLEIYVHKTRGVQDEEEHCDKKKRRKKKWSLLNRLHMKITRYGMSCVHMEVGNIVCGYLPLAFGGPTSSLSKSTLFLTIDICSKRVTRIIDIRAFYPPKLMREGQYSQPQ